MIWTVLTVNFKRLLHNPVELVLTFVVPVVFFSVFALIFSKGVGIGQTAKVKVAVSDLDQSDRTSAITNAIKQSDGLRVMPALGEAQGEPGQTQKDGRTAKLQGIVDLVRRGNAAVGIAVHHDSNSDVTVTLYKDSSDQVAPQVVSAIIAKILAVTKQAPPSVFKQASLARRPSVESPGPQSQPPIFSSQRDRHPTVDTSSPSTDDLAFSESADGELRIIDVMGHGKSNPVISLYAAGIAVMFLLFGASGGGGALLEERESATLDRLLSSQMSMDQLLLGKWFYLTLLGFVQVTVMFIWGQLVFGVDLLGHLDGFVMMTVVTSGAAAAFGLFLATLCKSRGQLNGLSVILILTMSALGGSMVPRYVMSDSMREVGQWTFNAWALDGYDKVFWRELPVSSLAPQLGVLMIAGVVFLLAARAFAVRWEAE